MKNEPAFPVVMTVTVHKGITKREYFAAMAMEAMLRRSSFDEFELATFSFNIADAMLAESEKSDCDK